MLRGPTMVILSPGFKRVSFPAVGPAQRVGAAQFGMPALRGAILVLHFKNDRRMRVLKLEFQDCPFHRVWMFLVIPAREAMVRERRDGKHEKPGNRE